MIVAARLTKDFTTLPNELLNDPALSFDAITVMGRLLALPPDWKVCLQNLRRRWGCGLERLKKVMRELIATGWVQRQPSRKMPDGSYSGGDYKVFNVRQPVQPSLSLDEPKTSPRKPKAQIVTDLSDTSESVAPESVTRTPYKNSNPTNTSPNPSVAGGAHTASQEVCEGVGGKTLEPSPAGPAGRQRRPAARAAVALDAEAEARFRSLEAAYPEGALRTRERDARAEFASLTPSEQAAAVMRARSYAESLRKRPGHAFSLLTWLRQTDFRALADRLAAVAAPEAAPLPRPLLGAVKPPERSDDDRSSESWAMAARGEWPRYGTVFVNADSPEGRAWEAHFAALGTRPVWIAMPGQGRGWKMPGAYPLLAEAM